MTDTRRLPPLLMLTDDVRLPDPLAAAARLPAGAAVVLRHYGRPAPERRALGRALAALCRRRRLRLLVAADWRLAAAVGADGLHLPEGLARGGAGLAAALAWRRQGGRLLTVAAHGAAGLTRARRLGADAALLSPVFATASHPGARPLGPVRFAALCRAAGLPVYALGGVAAATAPRLRGSGAAGVAAIGALAGGEPTTHRMAAPCAARADPFRTGPALASLGPRNRARSR